MFRSFWKDYIRMYKSQVRHDSQVATSLIAKVIENIGEYEMCVDQGLPRTGEICRPWARVNIPVDNRREII